MQRMMDAQDTEDRGDRSLEDLHRLLGEANTETILDALRKFENANLIIALMGKLLSEEQDCEFTCNERSGLYFLFEMVSEHLTDLNKQIRAGLCGGGSRPSLKHDCPAGKELYKKREFVHSA